MEAIKQTIIELRALNAVKEAPQLIGAETLRILQNNQVDVMKILREFKPEMSNRKYHQQLTSQLGFGKSNKNSSFNPFSIENLLAGSKHGVVNSLSGQVNNMFGNVSALAGLGVGALSNLGHYANNGQFSEAFNGMQAINNGAFAAAALTNAQLNSEHFAKHGLIKDGYEMSDMDDDDDSSSAGSYMSDEMLDVMMDDDLSTMKSNEKLLLLNSQIAKNANDLIAEECSDKKTNELKIEQSVLNSLAMNLSRKEPLNTDHLNLDADNCCSNSSIDSKELNSDLNNDETKDNMFKKRKKKDDGRENSKLKKQSTRTDEELCNNEKDDEGLNEPDENSSKETNQVQSSNHSAKKRILSELNDTDKLIKTNLKDESIDNQLNNNQSPTNEHASSSGSSNL